MASSMDAVLVPYENAEGIEGARRLVESMKGKKSIGIFIGPEGGFSEAEVQQVMDKGAVPVSLGPRILRAETAAMYCLSAIGAWSEERS